ncbi:MAG: nitrous oxide-stimulated promoter family protein [Acidobacteria bacterium]|nr:nitrous oxide-stimulated promoter family protein [Acidobacteriota bacterium]
MSAAAPKAAPRGGRAAAGNDAAIASDLYTLTRFIEVYCERKHAPAGGGLCPECRELLDYAEARLRACPYDPKPKCKACQTHCYAPERRQRIREVMKFSGMHFVKRGRIDWLVRYFLS